MIVSVRRPWTWMRIVKRQLSKRAPQMMVKSQSETKPSVIGQFEKMMAHQATIAFRSWDND